MPIRSFESCGRRFVVALIRSFESCGRRCVVVGVSVVVVVCSTCCVFVVCFVVVVVVCSACCVFVVCFVVVCSGCRFVVSNLVGVDL